MVAVDQFAVVSGTIPSSGNFAITHSDITTWSTKGVMLLVISGVKTDDSTGDDMRVSYAVLDKDGNGGCWAVKNVDGHAFFNDARNYLGTPDGVFGAMIDDGVGLSSAVLKLGFVSAGTGGPTLSVDLATETGFVFKAFLFATSGSGEAVAYGSAGLTYTGAPAAMDLYIGTIGQGTANSITTHHRMGIGVVLGDLTQMCVAHAINRTAYPDPSEARSKIHTDHFGSYDLTGTEDTLLITAINANGWSASQLGGGPPIEQIGLGIKFGDADRTAALVIEDVADDLGGSGDEDVSFTGLGFSPVFVLAGLTLLTADDTEATDATAGAFSLAMFTPDDTACVGVNSEVGTTGPSNTHSFATPTAIVAETHVGQIGYWASLKGMLSTGFECTFTQTVPAPLVSDPQPGKMLVLGISGLPMPPAEVATDVHVEEELLTHKALALEEDVHVTETLHAVIAPGDFLDSDTVTGYNARGESEAGSTGRGGSEAGGQGG